jgi:CzcA family heavy metal efflux pump
MSSGHPLDAVIHFSLRQRGLVVVVAAVLMAVGALWLQQLPIDVFPDLNRPTITLMTEAPGLSPEEVELLISVPVERAMAGAPGVAHVTSTSGVGLSVVTVTFSWAQDVPVARQQVAERLATLSLPAGMVPVMGPSTSIMGEILLIGITSRDQSTPQSALRVVADSVVRPRLLAIAGVAQVIPIGGGAQQLQVDVSTHKMLAYGVSFQEVTQAAAEAQGNSTGGFIEQQAQEVLVRNIGRTHLAADMAATPVVMRDGVPISLGRLGIVGYGTGTLRGDAGVNGQPGVVLSVHKQPGTSTTSLTARIEAALAEVQPSLPADVELTPLFRQATFIEAAVSNVAVALRDGAILVVIVLLLFLVNARTTLITLTAIPLSLLTTVLVFRWFGWSVNTMTLGGLAVAVGELVDDAVVDVENVHRRLRENRRALHPQAPMAVVFAASSEVRRSIVFATLLVVLVFVPLAAIDGIEGRLFVPLGVAYVVSILASLAVSLTVTPALCSWLLTSANDDTRDGDGALVRFLKQRQRWLLERTLDRPIALMVIAAALALIAAISIPWLDRAFLPTFAEGTATINLLAPPGTSLAESNRLGALAEQQLREIAEVKSTGRRTGRAELDEHAEGVHYTEIDVDFVTKLPDGSTPRPREEVLAEVRSRLALLTGINSNVGQPISHRLDHLLSGVRAQVVIKVMGNDLTQLRSYAAAVQRAVAPIAGVVDLQTESQVLIPQLRIRIDHERAARLGVRVGALATTLQHAVAGVVVGQVIDGPRSMDVVVRLAHEDRDSVMAVQRLLVDTPSGAKVPLSTVAEITLDRGPNQVVHDDGVRRIVVSCNIAGRDVAATAVDIEAAVATVTPAPGVYVRMDGQYRSQQSATTRIAWLSSLSLLATIALLHSHFKRFRLVWQVLLNLPLALIGSVAALWWSQEPISVATLVGLVTMCGIASRNTILMIDHYLHLMQHEAIAGESLRSLVIRGTQERMVPVMMTALTAGLALVPLVLAHGEAGKEILHPVAIVIVGGLLSSTLLDFVVTPAVFLRFYQATPVPGASS